MKADRRHELKENDLALAIEAARHYLQAHGRQLGMIVLVVLVVAAAVALGIRARGAASEDIWRRRSELNFETLDAGKKSLQTLASLTRDASDTKFVLSALLEQGQQALRLAQKVPVPPDRDLNDEARRAFEELLTRFPNNPLALGVGLCGLATVEENAFLLDDDLIHKTRADNHLKGVIENRKLNGTPFQRMAVDRRRTLDVTFTKVTAEPPPPPDPTETTNTDPVDGP